jgi:chorismate mutase/prephenate dehydratase
MKSDSLENLRNDIDGLDQKIQLLTSQRADLVAKAALVKKESNAQTAFYRPERLKNIIINFIIVIISLIFSLYFIEFILRVFE